MFFIMIISFYGEGCFKIQSGETVILTDPFSPESGLALPRFKADIILKTLTSIPLTNQQTNQPTNQLIFGPGEYNIKNIDIFGLDLIGESTDKFFKTIYSVEAENIKICFLGHISKLPAPEIAKELEETDILFIPAGGEPFIEQKSAVKMIKQIKPKIVIPSFYKMPGLKRPAADLKIFLNEINLEKTEQKEKLTIKKKDLAEIKKTEVAVLKI